MKTVLFYGDSLVYGKIPKFTKRYNRSLNFIGVIEKDLGKDYRIIDEGLRARTLSGENKFFTNRNGLNQFGPIIGSHLPLDLVWIFLGTNDCNKKDLKTEKEIYQSLLNYKNEIIEWCKNLSIDQTPKIGIIVPPEIRADQVIKDEVMNNIFDIQSQQKIIKIREIYKDFCENENVIFFDSNEFCITAENEGIHLDESNNLSLGNALSDKIKTLI